ncbi:hypothetical protein THASP1DRAFT_34596 [Thamnocephalis sphaerospora]|uniref:4-coumarate-CoA ligase n=1 Tax=Thamnocephalis sphaerospora TaxID=78915 RepID=A0A4P9XRH8_9FUNG|nr:hypothetical protein THASP1DRAFT_34596 [Thamnocephalis sphaerospora]|eukprot:RKP08694.1 hypothetical protein THASP1DRAFT_34596 [Thamnocephalis sphaerospora]
MLYRSKLPDVEVPREDVFHFLFERPDRRSGEHAELLIDAHSTRRMTAGQLRKASLCFAGGLQQKLGTQDGQVLAIFSCNDFDYPAVVFGSLAAGLTVTTANPACHTHELVHQLRNSNAKYIVAGFDVLSVAKEAAAEMGIPAAHVVVMGARGPDDAEPLHASGHITVGALLAAQPISTPVRLAPAETVTRTAYLCYSSGTTGRPKGVELTHYNVVANLLQCVAVESENWRQRPAATEVHVCMLPLYHAYALLVELNTAILRRSAAIVMRHFQLESLLQLIQRHRVTMLYIVPPICLMFAKDPLVDKYDLSSLRDVISAAAPLGVDVVEAVHKRLGIRVRQAYGMTEAAPIILMSPAGDVSDRSAGILLPNQEARIIDLDGNDVAPGETGELCVRGPNVMKGYLNNPAATTEIIDTNGFLHTGDIVRIDSSGRFYVVDRIKELIKYKGFQVAPADLEAILQKHNAVADAAVIGIQCKEQATELPKAYVALKPSHHGKISELELVAYVDARVAAHKRLRGGVEFIDVIPRSPSGKILRRLLRERSIGRPVGVAHL